MNLGAKDWMDWLPGLLNTTSKGHVLPNGMLWPCTILLLFLSHVLSSFLEDQGALNFSEELWNINDMRLRNFQENSC